MSKSFNLIFMYPFIINMIIILMMMIPTKLNKFHPLSFILILIILTFLICLNTNFLYKSWFNYILFLTMIGGLMVIYMYINSLSNNELFYINLNNLMMLFSKSILFIMIIYFIMLYFLEMNLLNLDFKWMYKLIYNEQINMNYLYMKLYYKSTIFLMMYLFYSMMIIMNICINKKSPLRQISF